MAKVLVVDDEDYRDILAEGLRLEGWEAEAAADGVEAIEWLKREPFDAVVLDRSMPRKGGDEVMHWIHEQRRLEKLCVVMLTAHFDAHAAVDNLKLGAWQFLQKPMKPSQMKEILAAGIAWKMCHAQQAKLLFSPAEDVIDSIREIFKTTLGPDAFFVHFVPPNGNSGRSFFTRLISRQDTFIYRATREETQLYQPILPNAATIMAVPVVGSMDEVQGVIVLESKRENGFGLQWREVLEFVANLLSLQRILHDATEERRSAMDLLYREFRHRIATHTQVAAMQVDLMLSNPHEATPKRLNLVRSNVQQIELVVSQLKRAASELPPQKKERTSLKELVEGELRGLGAEHKGITVTGIDELSREEVSVDREWMGYALNCILNNAIEAIQARPASLQKEEGEIVVRTEAHLGFIDLSIRDNGTGIAKSYQGLIFEPLFSTKPNARVGNKPDSGQQRASRLLGVASREVLDSGAKEKLEGRTNFEIKVTDSGDHVRIQVASGDDPWDSGDIPVPPPVESHGLGLYTARRVIQEHGGDIIAESKGYLEGGPDERGTTITIRLPI